jgi:hypothetical protein
MDINIFDSDRVNSV